MACKVQAIFSHSLDAEFKNMVRDKLLENCPIKLEQITNANNIFGPDVARLRVKSTITNPTRVEREYIPITRYLYVLYKFVTLTSDVMLVNGLLFLITLYGKIKMFTAKYIPNQTYAQIIRSLNKIVKLYERNGFVVNVVMMDMKFENNSDKIGNTEVNTAAAREHVGEIERGVHVIKERAQCIVTTIHFKSLHKQIVIHIIYYAMMWIN